MRRLTLSLLSLTLSGAALLAQPPGGGSPMIPSPGSGARLGGPGVAPQPVLDPNNRLDALLMRWEDRMKGVESILVRDCMRTDKSKNAVKTWKGEARYLKPNLAALRLVQQEDSSFYELMISTGNFLYEYRKQFKKLVIHELPPARAGNFDNNLLSFLFGMSAADAKRRYDLRLSKDVSAENPHYIYIDILPKFTDDKREFTRAQMVLFNATMLPRRLWFEHPNGEEVSWDLPNMDTTVKLRASDFTPPQPPPGWETEKQPYVDPMGPANDGKPRVIRTAGDR